MSYMSRIVSREDHMQFISFRIEQQAFCFNLIEALDVMNTPDMTRVPLSSNEVAGLLNLRGRIVTGVDLAVRLGLRANHEVEKSVMSIIVEVQNDLYSMLVDEIGEIILISPDEIETKPSAMDSKWVPYADGIYQVKDELIVILNTAKILQLDNFLF